MAETQKSEAKHQAPAAQPPSFVFVRNNEPRVRGVAIKSTVPKELGTDPAQAVLQMIHENVTFKPDINRITREQFNLVKKQANFLFTTVSPDSHNKPILEELPNETGQITATMISEIWNREMLLKMLAQSDLRSDMAPLIQAQLRRMDPKFGLDDKPIEQA